MPLNDRRRERRDSALRRRPQNSTMPIDVESFPLVPPGTQSMADTPNSAVSGRSSAPTAAAAANAVYKEKNPRAPAFLRSFSNHLFPGPFDVDTEIVSMQEMLQQKQQRTVTVTHSSRTKRSTRRRIFLVLTEPETSIASALFFAVLVLAISCMNIVMIIQTESNWQFTPSDCRSCGGPVSYAFDDDDVIEHPESVDCVCPPAPLQWTVVVLNGLVYFFTVEWILRLVTFCPPTAAMAATRWGTVQQYYEFLTLSSTWLDALAIFPYYIESMSNTNGFMSLRLLRLFRVFQLVRLGQYNETFKSLTTVIFKALDYLKLLVGVCLFGAAFFGSMIYYAEKGEWKYFDETGNYQFVRLNAQGVEEISPFSSIPSSFWWFAVTATSVGYGDVVPTSNLGQWITTGVMLLGVLVVAFPVSVFSDLWSKELKTKGRHTALDGDAEYEKVDLPWIDDDHVAVRKEDMIALLDHIRAIHDSKDDIRTILQRY